MAFQLPGSIISAIDKAKADAAAAKEAALPSYSQMLDAVKTGAVFKDTSAQLSALSSAGMSPEQMTSIGKLIDKAKSNFSIDMAVAKAGLAQKAKEAAAEGRELTEEEKNAALAPMNVMKNLQSSVSTAVSDVSSTATTVGTAFGNLVSGDGTAVLTSAGAAIEKFKAEMPPATIPNPIPGGDPIPNPAYEKFKADNAAKVEAMEKINSASASAGAGLLSKITADAEAAKEAKGKVIESLKADSFLSKIAKPVIAVVAGVMTGALDLNKLNLAGVAKLAAATPPPVPKVPPDPMLEKNNVLPANILNRIAAIKSTAPVEPSRLVTKDEVLAANSKAQTVFREWLDSVQLPWRSYTISEMEARLSAMTDQWIDEHIDPGASAIRAQSFAIQDSKPDASTWTDEEKKIVALQREHRAIYRKSSSFLVVEEKQQNYIIWNNLKVSAYEYWAADRDRYTMPADDLKRLNSLTGRTS